MGLLNSTRVSATVGGKEIILETGRVARQANGAIWIQCGGTVALVTVCEAQLETPKDFFRSPWNMPNACTPPAAFPATSSAAK